MIHCFPEVDFRDNPTDTRLPHDWPAIALLLIAILLILAAALAGCAQMNMKPPQTIVQQIQALDDVGRVKFLTDFWSAQYDAYLRVQAKPVITPAEWDVVSVRYPALVKLKPKIDLFRQYVTSGQVSPDALMREIYDLVNTISGGA